MGVTEGCEVQPGAGEEPFEERGPVLHPFQPGLHQGGQLDDVAFGEVGQGTLGMRPECRFPGSAVSELKLILYVPRISSMGSDQHSCSSGALPAMLAGHVPAVRFPLDHD